MLYLVWQTCLSINIGEGTHLRRNIWPAGITLHANEIFLINDKSSRSVYLQRFCKLWSSSSNICFFFTEMLACMV